jgi:amino acid transporter
MAPAGAVAFSIAAGAVYSNGALTLAVIVALVGSITVAVSIGQLAQHLPSAGSIYTYPAQGLHPWIGFLSGWGYAMIEAIIGGVTSLLFGWLIAGQFVSSGKGAAYTAWWIGALVAVTVLVALLNYFGVKLTTDAGVILGALEIIIFVLLSIWLIVKAGGHNSFYPFTLKYATAKGYSGLAGVFAASVFTVLAFIGFEAATPLAEETRNPKRNIKLAAIYSCLIVGVYYVFTTYAATVFFGPARFSTFVASGGTTGPWVMLAHQVWGPLWIFAFLAILNSTFANQNAAAAAATRTWYSMGRIRLLPSFLAHVHPHWRSPDVAVLGQTMLTLALGIWLGLKYGPYTAFLVLATILTAIMVLIYMAMNLSCIAYYLRQRRDEFNLFLHLVVPLIGLAFLIPVWMASVGIGHAIFSFISPLSPPLNVVGPVVGIWYALGIIYLIYLIVRQPERLRETRLVFEEETPATPPAGDVAVETVSP